MVATVHTQRNTFARGGGRAVGREQPQQGERGLSSQLSGESGDFVEGRIGLIDDERIEGPAADVVRDLEG
jgi:hypothetical protein